MRIKMHLSERICNLCRKQYLTDLLSYANKDERPLEESRDKCVICGRWTEESVGYKIETNEPIKVIEEALKTFSIVREKYEKDKEELIKRIREAQLKGETHIKIK